MSGRRNYSLLNIMTHLTQIFIHISRSHIVFVTHYPTLSLGHRSPYQTLFPVKAGKVLRVNFGGTSLASPLISIITLGRHGLRDSVLLWKRGLQHSIIMIMPIPFTHIRIRLHILTHILHTMHTGQRSMGLLVSYCHPLLLTHVFISYSSNVGYLLYHIIPPLNARS